MKADDIRTAVDEQWPPAARLLIEKAAATVEEHARTRIENEQQLLDALDTALTEANRPWYKLIFPSKKRFRSLEAVCSVGDDAERGIAAFAKEQGIYVKGTGYSANEEDSTRTAP